MPNAKVSLANALLRPPQPDDQYDDHEMMQLGGSGALPQTPTAEPDAGMPSAPTPGASPNGEPQPPDTSGGGTTLIPPDLVGDIPPPPIPAAPPGVGVGGAVGAGGSTFARPGSAAATPYRTMMAQVPHMRFGPGAPSAGGGVSGGDSTTVTGLGGGELGISPDEAAELLRRMAGGGMR